MKDFENNQFVVITKSDFMDIVGEMAKSMAQAAEDERKETAVQEEERYLSRKEVSEMLQVDYSTLWRWNKTGVLHNHKKGERGVLYLESEVRHFIAGKNGHV